MVPSSCHTQLEKKRLSELREKVVSTGGEVEVKDTRPEVEEMSEKMFVTLSTPQEASLTSAESAN